MLSYIQALYLLWMHLAIYLTSIGHQATAIGPENSTKIGIQPVHWYCNVIPNLVRKAESLVGFSRRLRTLFRPC